MTIPVDARAVSGRGPFARFWMAIGGLVLLVGAFRLAQGGGGIALLGGIIAIVAGVVVARRPALGIMIYLTTFLFTYPSYLRGVGNLTINNVLGLILLPLMLYGMLREGSWWIVRFKPLLILATVTLVMIVSGLFYQPYSEYGQEIEEAKIARSQRVQGPALIQTRDAGTKMLTRLAFLTFFVFFVRTPRDLKIVVAMIVACLMMTYFSVSTAEGIAGWGTGRLRVLETGAGVYAGRNPNKLAYFALFGLTLLWYGRRAIKSPIVYPFWAVVTFITFIMIPLTGSRSGLLNLLFFIGIVLLEGRFNYRKVVGLVFVTFFIAIQFGYDLSVVDMLFPEEVAQRLTKIGVRGEILEEEGLEAAGSAEGRVRTAQSALRVWRLHPFFGVGAGNFNTERAATDPFGTIGPPHNSYLWALSEGGLVTFILYLSFFWWVFRKLRGIEWEYQARFGPIDLGWMTSALRTVLIGFMLFSFFADMWHHELFYIIAGMCLSLIRLHQLYAETGQAPQPFMIGRQLAPARTPTPLPA